MRIRWICALLGALAVTAACAQAPKRVEKADDLPRFSYPVQGDLETIVRDTQRFAALARDVRRDTEATLAGYDIAENATRRQLLGLLVQLDLIEGRYDDALRRSAQIQQLQEKPADKLLSGLTVRAIAAGARKGERGSPAYSAEVSRFIAAELERLPYTVIRNDIMRAKAGMETLGEALALGRVRNVLQPVATQTGALSSDLAPTMVSARYALEFSLPLKATLVETYSRYLAAHKVDKPDIWAARDVALPAGRNYAPVRIVVWDSGVDAPIFGDRMLTEQGKPAMIAFDLHSRPSTQPLKPIPAALLGRLDALQGRSKGLSDLTSNIDSPEAAEVKALLSNLAPAEYKAVQEELRLVSVYQHGTHVAGIAMAGNPYARLANARIEFGHTLLPDPCPTRELHERAAAAFGSYIDFVRRTGARVVNMSWSGNLRSYEVELEQCGIGKDLAERKALAREYYDLHYKALFRALASAPEVLFVTSAGNAGNNPTFNDAYPSGIVLPNLVSVGAVDKAGDEASFTSYGPTVLLHANGYQVDSVVPGGRRIALSGTSMASPQVTNLAAKMLAVKPSLKPAEVIAIMRATADRTEDGRRTLVHPAKALAAVGYAPEETAALKSLFERSWEAVARRFPEWSTYRGDLRFNDQLADNSAEAVAAWDARNRAWLAEAKAIRRERLSADDRLSLDLFIGNHTRYVEEQAFPGWRCLNLGALGGSHTGLADLLRSSPVQTRAQVEQMLARMAAYPRWMDREIDCMRRSMALGWVPSKDVLARVLDQIDKQLPADVESGPYYAPFKSLGAGIPPPEQEALGTAGRAAIERHVVPAMRKLRAFVADEYLPRAPADGALHRYPEGRQVYEMLVRHRTTTRLSAAQIHEIGLRELAAIRAEMEGVMRQTKFQGGFAQFIEHLTTDPKFFHTGPDALLAGYRDISKRIDAEMPRLFVELPRAPYGVRAMPAFRGPDSAEYYNGPALDGSRGGYFNANVLGWRNRPMWRMATLTAHEAVPGHHLQIARATELRSLPEFRRGGGYTAFVEGWAVYAEALGREIGLYESPYDLFGHLQWRSFRAARLVADTGIHNMGWSRQQAIDFMVERTGMDRAFVTSEVDRYTSQPGQALGYMIGALKIAELREKSKAALGARFDVRRFHNAVIDNGALPLDVLEKVIEEWIAAEKAR
jgi:uncharacterized protein (DUF885 family)